MVLRRYATCYRTINETKTTPAKGINVFICGRNVLYDLSADLWGEKVEKQSSRCSPLPDIYTGTHTHTGVLHNRRPVRIYDASRCSRARLYCPNRKYKSPFIWLQVSNYSFIKVNRASNRRNEIRLRRPVIHADSTSYIMDPPDRPINGYGDITLTHFIQVFQSYL